MQGDAVSLPVHPRVHGKTPKRTEGTRIALIIIFMAGIGRWEVLKKVVEGGRMASKIGGKWEVNWPPKQVRGWTLIVGTRPFIGLYNLLCMQVYRKTTYNQLYNC